MREEEVKLRRKTGKNETKQCEFKKDNKFVNMFVSQMNQYF